MSVYIKSTLEFTTRANNNTHFAKPFLNWHVASQGRSPGGRGGRERQGRRHGASQCSLVSLSDNLLDGLWEAEEVGVEAQQEEEVESGKAGGTVLHNARPGAQRQPHRKSQRIRETADEVNSGFPIF